jgi:hypothetical protein
MYALVRSTYPLFPLAGSSLQADGHGSSFSARQNPKEVGHAPWPAARQLTDTQDGVIN